MTDKVQKIRKEVEKRYEYWKEKESNSHSIESETRMSECQHLLLMLDSLQEEPVSDECIYNRTLEERQRSCKFCSAACQVRIKEPVSEELEKVVEEIVGPTVLNAYGVKEIANRLRRTMIEPVSEEIGNYNHTAVLEGLGYQSKEEPVSEDLETDIAIRLGGVCHKQVWHKNYFSKEDCKAYCSLYKECQECSLDLCMIFFHDPRCHFEKEPVSEKTTKG